MLTHFEILQSTLYVDGIRGKISINVEWYVWSKLLRDLREVAIISMHSKIVDALKSTNSS